MVIRVWIEPGSSEPLRAQIRRSSDVSAGFERALTLTTTGAVCTAVQEWLADIAGDAAIPD